MPGILQSWRLDESLIWCRFHLTAFHFTLPSWAARCRPLSAVTTFDLVIDLLWYLQVLDSHSARRSPDRLTGWTDPGSPERLLVERGKCGVRYSRRIAVKLGIWDCKRILTAWVLIMWETRRARTACGASPVGIGHKCRILFRGASILFELFVIRTANASVQGCQWKRRKDRKRRIHCGLVIEIFW